MSTKFRSNVDYVRRNSNSDFNCWGATAYMLGWKKTLLWLWRDEIEVLLEKNTKPLGRRPLKLGDVFVYTDEDGDITHTAVYCARGKLAHKPGEEPFEYIRPDEVINQNPNYGELNYVCRPCKIT